MFTDKEKIKINRIVKSHHNHRRLYQSGYTFHNLMHKRTKKGKKIQQNFTPPIIIVQTIIMGGVKFC